LSVFDFLIYLPFINLFLTYKKLHTRACAHTYTYIYIVHYVVSYCMC
jgi:hypothetical protein